MNNSNENDFDRIANQMQDALNEFIGEMHPQWNEKSDSITITKKGAIVGIIKMQRAINWCKGHAATRHAMSHLTQRAADGGNVAPEFSNFE